MKRLSLIEIISSSLIVLWVYAALSKLLTFDTFKIQLSKSPLISVFAPRLALMVPVLELAISAGLLWTKLRLAGLYASLFLLIAFTAYLVAILNFSYYIPCSCGGILGKLSWEAHIVFNLFYTALTTLAILKYKQPSQSDNSPAPYPV